MKKTIAKTITIVYPDKERPGVMKSEEVTIEDGEQVPRMLEKLVPDGVRIPTIPYSSIYGRQGERDVLVKDVKREFGDFAELMRSKAYGPLGYGGVALVQEIRRHPRLRETIEGVARRLGRKIDLTQRLT